MEKLNEIMQQKIDFVITRYKFDGEEGLNWSFFQCWSKEDKDDLDRFLVRIKDPLAYEARTQESRFKAYIRRLADSRNE